MGPGAFALGLWQGLAGCGIHNETMCKSQKDQAGFFFLPLKFNCPPGRSLRSNGVSLTVYSAGLQTDCRLAEGGFENRPGSTGYVGWAGRMGSIKGSRMASFLLKARCHLCDLVTAGGLERLEVKFE
jgi:hypothetical protein